ncbi:MAG: NAD(P)-dependent oxidoreductase [Candidatus Heimdallarchaeota archaeon]|nr:NAD(P)-dependent oxidoreductase [Candidatus Heimdallarchaeota archaeon]
MQKNYNILITGAFGLIGKSILNYFNSNERMMKLEEKLGKVTIFCLDLPTKNSKRSVRKFKKNNQIKIIYGDIRNKSLIERLVKDMDVIFHLAFQLPPILDENEPIIRTINVDGLINIINSINNLNQSTKIIYPSSIDMYGYVKKENQPIVIGNPTNPTDHYGRHKEECVKLLKESNIINSVFVLTVVPPLHYLAQNPAMFDVEVDSNVELVHEDDVAKAFYNALQTEKVWNKTLHIAGGESCRLSYLEFINKMMIASGIGTLSRDLFKGNKYHFAFMDTTESQEILNYQDHSTEDIISDMKKNNKLTFSIIKLLRPIVRRFLINQSPYK